MQFKDIIGHAAIKQRLINSANENRISHAQLFLSNEGVGAIGLAVAYAQYIACKNRQATDSCGVCSACVKYNKLVHPDLHFAFPTNTTTKVTKDPTSIQFIAEWRKALLHNVYLDLFEWLETIGIDNKQGNISALESVDIIRRLALKPYESEFKVMIIWMAEKMNTQAANKILKLLEEPPEKTLFLLVVEQQEQLLSTIISRTQLIKIGGIDDANLAKALMYDYQLSTEQAQEVINMAEGSYNNAKRLAQETEGDNLFMQLFREWMLICFNKKTIELVPFIDKLEALKRERQKKFLTYCLHLIRESLILAYQGDAVIKTAGAEKQFLDKFHQRIIGADTIEIIEEFNNSIYHIERNANAKILFMDVSLKLFRWFTRQNKLLAEAKES
ncbi:MAG: DNA polymerase III subunit delta, partial [Bacteroidia bacterium]|nr:DNA polymerase III subunit delta [Bacteroidia bacterium]